MHTPPPTQQQQMQQQDQSCPDCHHSHVTAQKCSNCHGSGIAADPDTAPDARYIYGRCEYCRGSGIWHRCEDCGYLWG